ncbi:uncharacterized protein LOC142320403 isoform X2 [Lycorma delicatula]|uniref:uncharacterized protein LOC142320403 isoform X2 n=1 Tax=Lycorma delicatula TaxID=130591 RepID=UPI003F511587
MAVENGYGTELEMVVDEENHDGSFESGKQENDDKKNRKESEENSDKNDQMIIVDKKSMKESEEKNDNETSVVMEVDEEPQEGDPLEDNETEVTGKSTSTDRMRKLRAKLKEDAEAYKRYLERERERARKRRQKLKTICLLSQQESDRQRKYIDENQELKQIWKNIKKTDASEAILGSYSYMLYLDRVITASKHSKKTDVKKSNEGGSDGSGNVSRTGDNNEDIPPPEPVVTEYVNEYSGTVGRCVNTSASGRGSSNTVTDTTTVKIKEEPPSVLNEIVLIDSEEEKEEKPKVKVVATRNMQLRQNNRTVNNRTSYMTNTSPAARNNNNSDFQIVSVDDDSPMNKNDPMNVFLCSTEEREFRKDYFKDPSSNVLKQRLHCTICDIHIGACPQNSKNMVCHRFLKVLICRKCANFYGQGDFPQDDGSDEFCRWCGEGGEVFLCNSCSNVFCQACILRNFGMQEVKRVDRLENWDCYVCDTRPLWTLRAIAFALFTYVRRIKVVAYRNGMYQTINSSNAKVSKSDLMALETDLSTCCPKEVKAAAAAASAPPPNEVGEHAVKQPTLPVDNRVSKTKDTKVPSQVSNVRTPPAKPPIQNKVNDSPYMSNNLGVQGSQMQNVYGQSTPRPSSSKRSKQQSKQQIAPPAPWQQPQLLPEYYPPPGKRVPPQPPGFPMTQPSVMYPHPQQSTLRTALVGQQPGFVPSPPIAANSYGGQSHLMMYGGSSMTTRSKDGQSEPGVLQWFNGILTSLMDTMKNIDNRLVFIRNSTSNLISQNEVSFLVNQLHNLLKVSCSKMQEVDCDLLKNYKEFIDKSEITVNDFDDIVREFPEFFKPPESNTEVPESVDADPDPPEDINPMALVEVIEEGDQQSQAGNDTSKQTSKSGNEKNKVDSKDKNVSGTLPSTFTIKKEVITNDNDETEVSDNSYDETVFVKSKEKRKPVSHSLGKRKVDSKENNSSNKSKVQTLENIKIKKEKVDVDDENEILKIEPRSVKKCSVKLTTVNAIPTEGQS